MASPRVVFLSSHVAFGSNCDKVCFLSPRQRKLQGDKRSADVRPSLRFLESAKVLRLRQAQASFKKGFKSEGQATMPSFIPPNLQPHVVGLT